MHTLGIDSGSTTTKAALYDGDKIISLEIVPTSANPRLVINELYKRFGQEADFTVTTGYGRTLLDASDKKVTEITCHAKGALFLQQDIGAVIDIGGQDSKAILLDSRDHGVKDFVMNDKCAAGTGKFVEIMLKTLEITHADLDEFVRGYTPVEISSMCAVFAESEMISLLAGNAKPQEIAMGIIHSICKRTAIFAQKLSLEGPVFFSGGLAGSKIFRTTLEEYLKIPVITSEFSQYAGAIGAAIIAWQQLQKRLETATV